MQPIKWNDNGPFREAKRIIGKLQESGFVAYLAGGCVRDGLLGRAPKDFDVATDATPSTVRDIFGIKKTVAFGASFGVIGVLPEPSESARQANQYLEPTEVATFRSDGVYSDGRRPDSVCFGNAQADAMRRDFTINGLFCDPFIGEIIDYVGGAEDLRNGILRTIDSPKLRFEEDKLRMLRAIRFAAILDFEIEANTLTAIQTHAKSIKLVSGERIGAEMRKLFNSNNAHLGIELLSQSNLAETIWPQLTNRIVPQVKQRLRLSQSLFNQPLKSEKENLETVPVLSIFVVKLALALSAMKEPLIGLDQIRHSWKLSTEEVRSCTAAIDHWKNLIFADQAKWSALQPLLINRDIETMLAVAKVLSVDNGQTQSGIQRCENALQRPTADLNPPPLITGNDLHELGFQAGPIFQEILRSIRIAQLDEKISTPTEAIQRAIEYKK